jgi:hypothetical protein
MYSHYQERSRSWPNTRFIRVARDLQCRSAALGALPQGHSPDRILDAETLALFVSQTQERTVPQIISQNIFDGDRSEQYAAILDYNDNNTIVKVIPPLQTTAPSVVGRKSCRAGYRATVR